MPLPALGSDKSDFRKPRRKTWVSRTWWSREEQKCLVMSPGSHHGPAFPQTVRVPLQVCSSWTDSPDGTCQKRILLTHQAMGNVKTALKIITDGFHASKDNWDVNVIVQICMSCPAAQNAPNKDFSAYPLTEDVHPMSVGHIFFWLFSILTLFCGKVGINIKYLITQYFAAGQFNNEKDGRKTGFAGQQFLCIIDVCMEISTWWLAYLLLKGNKVFQRYRHLIDRHCILFALLRPPLQCESCSKIFPQPFEE